MAPLEAGLAQIEGLHDKHLTEETMPILKDVSERMRARPHATRMRDARQLVVQRALSQQALRLSSQTGIPRAEAMEILRIMLGDGSLVVITEGEELGALPVDDEKSSSDTKRARRWDSGHVLKERRQRLCKRKITADALCGKAAVRGFVALALVRSGRCCCSVTVTSSPMTMLDVKS